jgi:serine/threonine protein phosphatase PrpC
MKIVIPISIGELLNKISILQIKSQFTNNPYVNESRIQFTQQEIENAYQEIILRIEGDNHSKVVKSQPKQIKEVEGVLYQ